jgi:ADP-ribosylglycohydrolase
VGDALGAPVEFQSLHQIRAGLDEPGAGVRTYTLAYGRLGAITDDTQMTLFTAEGLLRAQNRQIRNGLGAPEGAVFRAYQRWLGTQMTAGPPPRPNGWLAGLPELYDRRAPGNTCLSALRTGRMGRPDRPINNSKGCGGVMRVAPVALAPVWDPWELGCAVAATTHTHPLGFLSSGALALILSELMSGASIARAVDKAVARLKKEPEGGPLLGLVEAAMYAAEIGEQSPRQVEALGEGWVAEEALAIGVYCAAVVDDFTDGVALAVTHGGDSDSTGSIAGQLLGTHLGIDAIPASLLDALELKDVIETLCQDIHRHFHTTEFQPDAEDWARYPG